MNANPSADESIQRAYERFYQLARPTWSQRVAAADAALEQSQNRRADGRRRQFSVGIADRAQLDALSEVLGLPRSKVINLALDELAETVEGFDDFYAELFVESCQCAAHYLSDEYNLAGDEAVAVAERFGKKYLPTRGRWLKILHGNGRPTANHTSPVRFDDEGGSDADLAAKKEQLWERFEEKLTALFNGQWQYQIERWIET